ncbi:MAG TPA: class I SAM-dependent methyltransferase [Chthoniobacterales bacterium]|jgi:SAM-dependent methyltransferase
MKETGERDYILGTHDEEVERLGLQHRVWRPVVLKLWQHAGITVGKRVLDLGAGPGYAAIDLANIVGPTGEIVALERSSKFVGVMQEACRLRGLDQVRIHEVDLMTDDLPKAAYDFSWCRWVLSFVSDPGLLIKKLAGVMPVGSLSIFHEYGHYLTWRFSPRRPKLERFAEEVSESWRSAGGDPDVALNLLPLLSAHGFVVRSAIPRIYCVSPADYMWQWPAAFIESGTARLQDLGRVDAEFVKEVRSEFAAAEANANSRMVTPLVLEVVAERTS